MVGAALLPLLEDEVTISASDQILGLTVLLLIESLVVVVLLEEVVVVSPGELLRVLEVVVGEEKELEEGEVKAWLGRSPGSSVAEVIAPGRAIRWAILVG